MPDADLPADLVDLRAVAEAATPGPWEAMVYDSGLSSRELNASVITASMGDRIAVVDYDGDAEGPHAKEGADAYFIAAANPERVLALLDTITDLRAEVDRLLSPERDTTGLTYGDKAAWRALIAERNQVIAALERANTESAERAMAADTLAAERDQALGTCCACHGVARSRAEDFEGRYETAHASRMHAEECYRREQERAEAAEAALARVSALADDPTQHLVRWIDGSHLVDVSAVRAAIDAPSPLSTTDAEEATE